MFLNNYIVIIIIIIIIICFLIFFNNRKEHFETTPSVKIPTREGYSLMLHGATTSNLFSKKNNMLNLLIIRKITTSGTTSTSTIPSLFTFYWASTPKSNEKRIGNRKNIKIDDKKGVITGLDPTKKYKIDVIYDFYNSEGLANWYFVLKKVKENIDITTLTTPIDYNMFEFFEPSLESNLSQFENLSMNSFYISGIITNTTSFSLFMSNTTGININSITLSYNTSISISIIEIDSNYRTPQVPPTPPQSTITLTDCTSVQNDSTTDGFTYTTIYKINNISTNSNVVFPSTENIKRIGQNTKLETDTVLTTSTKNITSIIIPKTVTYIGNCAFIEALNLNNVQFEYPVSINTLDNAAFIRNSVLSHIIIPNSVTYIGSQCFNSCNKLQSLDFEPNIKLPIITGGSFCLSALTSITIPASVTEIQDHAFSQAIFTFNSDGTINNYATAQKNIEFQGSTIKEIIFEGPKPRIISSRAFCGIDNLKFYYYSENEASFKINGVTQTITVYSYGNNGSKYEVTPLILYPY